MKKKVFTLVCLAATFGALSLAAFAQIRPLVTASIPFPFIVEKTQMPAGNYTFERLQANPGVLAIRSADGTQKLIVLTERVEARGEGNETNLVFDKIGGRYFLSRIWTVGNDWGLLIPEAKEEHQMVRVNANHHNG